MYKRVWVQKLPMSVDEAWAFFSSPANLAEITPSKMGFTILGDVPKDIYPGSIIQYKVKPVLGIPMRWVTEITQVREGRFFVDEQRVGPYKIWHHQHHFRAIEGGVEMTDILHYKLPMGLLGKLGNGFVRREIDGIFKYRQKKLEKLFTS